MRTSDCHPDRKHYAKGLCAACHQAEFKKKHPEYRDKMRAYLVEYRRNNPERCASYEKKRRSIPENRIRDAKTSKDNAYKKKYGMTLQDALGMLKSQNDACAMCAKQLTVKTMNVDHCHKDGFVRGILCTGCNTGLGLLGDSIDGLKNAMDYLVKSAQKNLLLADKEPT